MVRTRRRPATDFSRTGKDLNRANRPPIRDLAASLVLAIWLIAPAGGAPSATAPAAGPAAGAEQTVRGTTVALLEMLAREQAAWRADPALAGRSIEALLAPHVDFPTMGRLLLGPHWRQASSAQRDRFLAEFRRLLLRTYAHALVEFVVRRGLGAGDIEYAGSTATRDGRRVLVRTRIRTGQGAPVPVHYSMRRVGEAWKVYDVSVDAFSLVTTYRSSFDREIQQHGIDGLIERLAGRNAGSADGVVQR